MTRLRDEVVSHRMSADMKTTPVMVDTCEHNGTTTTTENNTKSVPAADKVNSISSNRDTGHNDADTDPLNRSWSTPYDRLSRDLSRDQKCLKEITLGKRIGFYRMRGELGSGNFSQVKLGIHALTKEKVAIKILDKTKLDQKTQRLLSREISSMERLHHPNVIRLYEVIETLAKLHIIMEYATGGELFTKISNEGRLTEKEARPLFAQIIAAVEHMHENHIIHRDLKAENIFFANAYVVKIGDFGFSIFSHPDQALSTFCGSPPYAAPELFKDESYYGIFVDMWALGILLYFMVTGIIPFRADTVAKLKKCILDGSYNIPVFVSESCQSLIRRTLKPLPHDRLTLNEMKHSEWLEGEEFPEPIEPFQLNPVVDTNNLTTDEMEAHKTLRNLGINEEHFRKAHGKDSRSSITGTYRIVLHKIQKKGLNQLDSYEMDADSVLGNKENSIAPVNKRESRLCVIL